MSGEQLDLFTYRFKTVEPCWRWYKESMFWHCPEFVKHCKKACGTCSECETPEGDWFAGCDFNCKPGRKISQREKQNE